MWALWYIVHNFFNNTARNRTEIERQLDYKINDNKNIFIILCNQTFQHHMNI